MKITRRKMLQSAALTTSAALLPECSTIKKVPNETEPLKLGLMTYNLAKDWDIDTIIKNCTATGFEHVELRTTHAHGVEVTLSKAERAEVRQKFEDAGLKISLASAFRYHFNDPAQLRENIEGTKAYTKLAQDIGALGIRVFPNALLVDEGVPEEVTLQQIGRSLAEVGDFGHEHGVDIRMCVHGKGTKDISKVKKIIDYADTPHAYINWNCNPEDLQGEGFEANFRMLGDRIRGIHMHELWEDYPYRRFFELLKETNYQGYCNAEIETNPDPVRMMRYYRALFLALQNVI